MPDWLQKKDNYIPVNDKDAFINKSILSLFKILSKFKMQTNLKDSKYEINALVKLLSVLLFIIFVSMTKSFTFVIGSAVLLLVVISLLNAYQITHILKLSLTVGLFTFIIFLPSVFLGYGSNIIMVTLKVLCSVAMINTLAYTTKWNDLFAALTYLHVPSMFIFVIDITIKYIIILGEFSLDLLYALKLRSVGRSHKKNNSLGGIMGSMFIKSSDMADDMYKAMECRGFTGEYKFYKKLKLKFTDYITIIFAVLYVSVYFYLNRL